MKPQITYNNLFDGRRLVSAVPVGVCSSQIDIDCNGKHTSYPDQLAQVLRQIYRQ